MVLLPAPKVPRWVLADQPSRRRFRWHPTQRQQIQKLLRQYMQQNSLARDQTPPVAPEQLLGPFAQDEVVFYVEAEAPGKPAAGTQRR